MQHKIGKKSLFFIDIVGFKNLWISLSNVILQGLLFETSLRSEIAILTNLFEKTKILMYRFYQLYLSKSQGEVLMVKNFWHKFLKQFLEGNQPFAEITKKSGTSGCINLVTQHYCLLLLGKVAFSTAQHGAKQANKYAVRQGLLNVKSNLLKASHEVYLS